MEHIEEATIILGDRRRFCEFLNQARLFGVPGAWSGSAYRHHPCGIKQGTIKMSNEWNVHDYCSIHITDGDGWSDNYCTNPAVWGDPHPKPINGESVRVWDDGQWVSEEFRIALEPTILNIIAAGLETICTNRKAQADAEEAQRQEKAREHDAAVTVALAKAQGDV